jgi:hypothetical protein
MAHFAKLDDNNVVLEVHVVNNAELDPENEEASGIAFLTQWSGGYSNWKQTSYNKTIRKNYACVGYTYDEEKDAFIPKKPFDSWVLNTNTWVWNAPVDCPQDGKFYDWDEPTTSWVEVEVAP